MKNRIRSALIFVLCAFLLLSAAACKAERAQDVSDTIEYTEYDFIQNSGSDYKIVLPAETLYNERLAADEINSFVFEASGIKLPCVADTDVEYSADAKLIILGNTAFNDKSGVDFSSIPEQGYTVKTVDSNVFICGENYGVLYGAYDFLHDQLDYEMYAVDEIALARNVTDLKLVNFNKSDSPDILYRSPSNGDLSSALSQSRMRMNGNIWMTENGNWVHNSFDEFFPKSKYESTKRDLWYSLDGEQLCYTARGNAEELALMQNTVLERLKELVNKYFGVNDYRGAISFTQEDEAPMCTCDACSAEKQKYGTNAAAIIHFINPVAREFKAWLDETYPGHEVDIVIFAYQDAETAPVKIENGQYVPIDDTVILEDNVGLFYAPFYADYLHDFYHEKNTTYLETFKKWSVISDNLYLWTYNASFINYMAWFDTFNIMSVNYKMARDFNVRYLFDNGRYNTSALTGFDYLKSYLNAKLSWDVDADYAKLLDNFFLNYFKDAEDPMRKYFDDFRTWMEYLKATNETLPGRQNSYIYTAENFPKQVLEKWMKYIDEAYEAIAPMKERDPQTYEKLYGRICKESLAVRFQLIQLHAAKYEASELEQMKIDFKKDADYYGFTLSREYNTLQEDVYSAWGM